MKKIVVSGVNIVSGGMMSVFKDCLRELLSYDNQVHIYALVHKKGLFSDLQNRRITYLEFPAAKCSWFLRCYYEYVYFYGLSKRICPDMWLSMHDMSPRVLAKVQAVYCHNAAPFFNMRFTEYFKDIKITLFVLFYKYLYRINIHSNNYVIVQQNWMREKFKQMYDIQNVIVAHPVLNLPKLQTDIPFEAGTFIYPATPQMYKNIELLCEAAEYIQNERLKIYITIDGSENQYARQIVEKYSCVSSIFFIGRQPREKIFEYYNRVEGLLFPSRLESWGMPLSEFAQTGKVIFVADLEYAHEVLDKYSRVRFLSVEDVRPWGSALKELLNGTTSKNEKSSFKGEYLTQEKNESWTKLFDILWKKDKSIL